MANALPEIHYVYVFIVALWDKLGGYPYFTDEENLAYKVNFLRSQI